MKKNLLPLTSIAALSALLGVCVFAADGAFAPNLTFTTQTKQEVAPATLSASDASPPALVANRVVMRLPYKATQPDVSSHPNQISFYAEQNEEMTFHRGRMICTDWQGNLYFYDPVSLQRGLVKKFDNNGKLLHAFELPPIPGIKAAGVTRKGTLWIVMSIESADIALPILAFKPDQKKPFLDWRFQLPTQLKQIAQETVEPSAPEITPETKTYWSVLALTVESTDVHVYLEYTHLGVGKDYVGLRGAIDGDEPSKLRIEVVPKSQEVVASPVAPDGSQWFITSGAISWEWENEWLWKQGQPQGEPLLRYKDILKPQSWWQKTFTFEKGQEIPALLLDGETNIYQVWGRQANGPIRKFYMGSGVDENRPRTSEGEKALVVLNAQRQIIGYLPWTLCYFELFENWIFPLPDGSGFYRQEYTPKELVVYFYPLPKPKI